MTDLSKVTRIEVVDGYGRTHSSFNADHITCKITDGELTITHDGDTSYGTRSEQ